MSVQPTDNPEGFGPLLSLNFNNQMAFHGANTPKQELLPCGVSPNTLSLETAIDFDKTLVVGASLAQDTGINLRRPRASPPLRCSSPTQAPKPLCDVLLTPKTARKRHGPALGDTVKQEGRLVRRSMRILEQDKNKRRRIAKDDVIHIGDHSFTPANTLSSILLGCKDAGVIENGPGLLDSYAGMFKGDVVGFVRAANRQNYNIDSNIFSRDSDFGAGALANIQTSHGILKAGPYPFQWTRMLFSNTFVTDAIERTKYVNCNNMNGGPDPRDLGTRIAATVPFPRACDTELAAILNMKSEVYDVTALYTKAMFYALLLDRMTDQGIPHGTPDLANAPVTYARLSNNAATAQQLLAVVREYTERGWFVLVEHLDFERVHIPALHQLAMPGACDPPNPADFSVAAQSIRWPAIRFLVIVTGVLPVYPVDTYPYGQDMHALALYFATARGDHDLLQRAWYQANYLVGSEWISRYPPDMLLPGYWEDNPNEEPFHLAAELDRDDPFEIEIGPNNAQVPGPHHFWNDGNGGDFNGGEQHNYMPLQWPNPDVAVQARNAAAMAAFENRRQDWVNYRGQYALPRVQGEDPPEQPPRNPEDFEEQPPVPEQPVPGTVRGQRQLAPAWRNAINRVHQNRLGNAQAVYPNVPEWPNDRDFEPEEKAQYANATNFRRLLTPFYECNLLLEMPAPYDTCCIWRWLGYKRSPPKSGILSPNTALTGNCSMTHLARLSVWSCAHIFAATSTCFYNFNLSGSVLQQVKCDVQVSLHANQLLRNTPLLYRPAARALSEQPYLAAMVRLYIGNVLGCQLPFDIFSSRDWSCHQRRRETMQVGYLTTLGTTTVPIVQHVISLARWYRLLPLEWGLFSPGSSVDLTAEITVSSFLAAQRGWRSWLGESLYTQLVSSDAPYKVAMYGTLVANYITMRVQARDGNLVPPQLVPFQCGPAIGLTPAGDPANPLPGEWVPQNNLGFFMPLTQPTYDWEQDQLRLPVYVQGGQIPLDDIVRVRHYKGQQNGVGIEWNPVLLPDVPQLQPQSSLTPFFDMLKGLSLPPTIAKEDQETKTSTVVSEKQAVKEDAVKQPNPTPNLPTPAITPALTGETAAAPQAPPAAAPVQD